MKEDVISTANFYGALKLGFPFHCLNQALN